MIDFFTDPYKDELIYSAIARYHFYSGNVDYKDTIEECFGKRSVVPILELAGRLDYFSGQLGGSYTSDKIINDNTIFPYYAPFMDESRREDVINKMKSDGGISLYTEIGIVAGSVCKKNHIYYCPYCAKDEVEKYGEAYIHREHQLQGIILCPHHGCKLKKYQKGRLDASKVEYVRFVNDLIDFTTERFEDKYYDKYLRLSKDAYYLLIHNLNKFDKDKMFDRYRYFLYEKGFIRDGGSVKQRELYEAFIDYYGEEFLQQLECSIDYDNEYNWLKVITRKSKRHSHPLRHLLLIDFLSDSIDYLFNADIHDINVNSQQHIYDISKCNISCMDQYKKSILDFIADNPGIKRTKLRKKLMKEYTFLYRYDKKWLFDNLPKKTKPSNNFSENRVDWQARDNEYLKLLQSRYNELLSSKIPIRITKGSLAKVFGILPNLEKKLWMMPMTEKFLNDVCENVQQFQLRRCKYVVDKFIRNEEKIKIWKVQRIAGIRTNEFKKLKEEVVEYINGKIGKAMGKMQLKLENWPFDKGVEAQLIWIGEPFKYQNKWMIDTYFNDGKSTKRVIQDWANIHFLSIDKYYIDGDLNSEKILDKDNKTKIIDIDLSGIMPKYNENDWRIKGTRCKSKSRTYNFYNNKLYTIPIIEIVRSVLAPNTFMLNNILYNNTFEDYFTYNIADDVLNLYFNSSYKTSNLKDTYFNHFAWIISNRNILNMVESIGYNASFKDKMMFDFNMKHFKFTARVKENKAGYTILEIIKLKEKRINFNEIQVFHPSFEEYEKSDGSKKWTYTNVNRNKGDKRVIADELDGSNKMTESIEDDFIMHEYVKSPEIHRKKTGHANRHMTVDENTKVYLKEDDKRRTLADEGGFNTGKGIDAVNVDLQYSKLSRELQEFIKVLQQLRKTDGIKSIDIEVVELPLGRKFSHLSDGITRRRAIVGKIVKLGANKYIILEIEREGKSLSTLLLLESKEIDSNYMYSKVLGGLVSESGKWSKKVINGLEDKGILTYRINHTNKTNYNKAIDINSRLI